MAASSTSGFKSKAPPPPLRLHSSTLSSSSNGRSPSATHRQTSFDATHSGASTPTANHKLLYELPPSSSSPKLRGSRENSRTRQTNPRRMHSLGGDDAFDTGDDTTDLTSPLSRNHRPRSLTPSHTNSLIAPLRSDLEAFALNCKAWFFAQDAAAGKAMTSALAAVPPSQKATYTKLQASVRSAYHTWTSLNRLREFHALVGSTSPGSSLSARGILSSPQAKKERATRFSQFVKLFCTPSAPGTHPFFEGLYAVLRLQTLPEALGGAGGRRICWEIDDAVFLESGGKDFMTESIVQLKGMLGFDSRKANQSQRSYETVGYDSDTDSSLMEGIPSQPQLDLTPRIITSPAAVATAALLDSDSSHSLYLRTAVAPQNRGRAHSDPFSDPSQAVNSPPSGSRPTPLPSTDSEMLGNQQFPPASPSYATFQQHDLDLDSLLTSDNAYRPPTQRELDLIHTPQYRIWITPSYLSNLEIASDLLPVFPSFISKKPLPRFAATSKGAKGDEEVGKLRRPDLEEGVAMIPIRTGKIWISFDVGCARDDGWKVGLWARFVLWVKSVFR